MGLDLRITSGAKAGTRTSLTRAVAIAGRHPECDLPFDAHKDTDVSTRHAEFRSEGDGWVVRDLGSTNGTFVNGKRITGQTRLRKGDVLTLGAHGPRIEITGLSASTESPTPATAKFAERLRPSTQERVAVAVAAQTSSLRKYVVALSSLVVIGVGSLMWVTQRNAAQSRETIEMLLARSDSLSAALQRTIDESAGRQAGLDSLASILQRERAQIQRQLQSGSANVGQITTQLDALDRRANQVAAIGANYRTISEANMPGLVFLVVERANGRTESATAFSIRNDGLLVTNKHVVIDADGRPPRRIGLFFARNPTWYYAQFLRASETADVALLKVDASGEFPTVKSIASSTTAAPGDAVALMGFPLGTTLERGSKTPSLNIGAISKIEPDLIQIEAYSAEGASGSPAFDADGNVIGVLFGSPVEAAGRIIFLVPSSALVAELRPDERALVR